MSTTALVPVFAGTLAGQPTQLCNARDLHATLEVGKDFSTWIKDRIEQYGFAEGEDYSPVSGKIPGKRGQPRTDYHLTLDMAKELAMVENNERGRQVRRYFIAVEKEARAKVGAGATAAGQKLLPAPDKLTKALRQHINRTAHAVALKQYDNAQKLLTDCALDNLACGATEANAMQYVEALASYAEDMTLVNVRDLQEMVWNATSAINAVGAACAAIQRVEQRTGLKLYHRPSKDGMPADFHKHDSLVHEVVRRIAGEIEQ